MLRLELKVFIGLQTKKLFCCHRCFNWFYLILDRLFEKCSRFFSVFLDYPDVMCLPKKNYVKAVAVDCSSNEMLQKH